MKVFNIVAFRNSCVLRKLMTAKQTPKSMKVIERPITSNIKGWYRDAGEKLNDIYLEQTTNNASTYISAFNKNAYEALPKVIKDALKPSDVSSNGHIDQDRINELWEAAKKANKSGVYGYAPTFRSSLEDSKGVFMPSTEIPDSSIGIELGSTDLASSLGDTGEHFFNSVETAVDTAQNISEHAGILEHLSDLFG